MKLDDADDVRHYLTANLQARAGPGAGGRGGEEEGARRGAAAGAQHAPNPNPCLPPPCAPPPHRPASQHIYNQIVGDYESMSRM